MWRTGTGRQVFRVSTWSVDFVDLGVKPFTIDNPYNCFPGGLTHASNDDV